MGKAYVQVLGCGNADCSASVLLFVDAQRYLFNVGDGTQRFCVEHRIRLKKLSHVFLTRVAPETVGGLPGMLLTAADQGTERLSVVAPPPIHQYLRAARHFLYRPDVRLHIQDEPKTYQDEHVVIRPVCINTEQAPAQRLPPSFGTRIVVAAAEPTSRTALSTGETTRRGPAAAEGEPPDLKRFRVAESWLDSGISPAAETTPGPCEGPVFCYVLQTAAVPGKFDVQRARQLGIPAGPLFGQLKSGKSVTLEDGTVVQPAQCVAPPQPGAVVVLVDCPSSRYIPSLVLSSSGGLASDNVRENAVSVIHMTPRAVLLDPRYQEWMTTVLPARARHVLVAKDTCRDVPVFQTSYLFQACLHRMHPGTFPMPKVSRENPGVAGAEPATVVSASAGETAGVVSASPLLAVHMLPDRVRGHVDVSDALGMPDSDGVVEQVAQSVAELRAEARAWLQEDTVEMSASLSALVEGVAPALLPAYLTRILNATRDDLSVAEISTEPAHQRDVQVLFTGTGSALPSKLRNVTGHFIRLGDSGRAFMLDAGEGAFGQLVRAFGRDGALDHLARLDVVWISHVHADHHLGLIRVMQERQHHLDSLGASVTALTIVAPHAVLSWLAELVPLLPQRLVYRGVRCGVAGAADAAWQDALGMSRVQIVPVHHCSDAWGIALEHKDGWKLVFSGDTMPCASLAEAGRGATLLIHEATLADDLAVEAAEKRHSTTRQAIEQGVLMDSQVILLTHFSQRYPRVPMYDDEAWTSRVCVATDLMHVDMSRMHHLPHLLPTLQLLGCIDSSLLHRGDTG